MREVRRILSSGRVFGALILTIMPVPTLSDAGLTTKAMVPEAASGLTFEQRVEAQRAIERVYWSHRIWPKDNPTPKPPIEAVMSEEVLRGKVEDYLKKSSALEKWWKRPITPNQLQAEMERMARESKAPDVLRELFEALGDDPYLIAETLVRQTLADRLVRNWYAYDTRFHGDSRAEAEEALARTGGADEMKSMGGRYSEATFTSITEDVADPNSQSGSAKTRLGPDAWSEHLISLARRYAAHPDAIPLRRLSRLVEDAERFYVVAVLSRKQDELTEAAVVWPKTGFESWWTMARPGLGTPDLDVDERFDLPMVAEGTCAMDSWEAMFSGPPSPRYNFTTVWTGAEMIVWGGAKGGLTAGLSTGGRYNPAIDTWTPTSTAANVPPARSGHKAVWTGTEMIVWGGANTTQVDTGGRYNPATDSWQPTSTGANVPAPRQYHTAVWTGTEMVVWGGFGGNDFDTGGRYDPSTDSWAPTSTGANVPSPRYAHTAVWTGTEMIVWGGGFNSGGRYNPSSDSWVTTSTGANVPAARSDHTAVWTGTEMIVWGGLGATDLNTGGRYNPATNSWLPTSVGANVPTERSTHASVWTGTEMIVWGGYGGGALNTGGRYNPSTNSWLPTSTGANVPAARYGHKALWSGSEMIVWGGFEADNVETNTGGRYDPSTNSWVPTSIGADLPTARYKHTGVWTGSEMIVWGGGTLSDYLNTGGRYDPTTNTWVPTSTGANVPAARLDHTAVWTGTEVIVWGGAGFGGGLNTGGRYDPATDAWIPTSTGANVPSVRFDHTAVWTGTEMIIWGQGNLNSNSGARYDPSNDSWIPTSTGASVPSPRRYHSAVWTGNEMIVWGGYDGTELDTGGRYSPSTNSWVPTSDGTSAPAARYAHTAIWTGTEMIVWGGINANQTLNSGGRYAPATDSWASTSTGTDVPAPRQAYTVLWSGAEMLVWGGWVGDDYSPEGGRYDPSTNRWTPTSTGVNVPNGRSSHAAVWTGTEMIVWGGDAGSQGLLNDGGRYCLASCMSPATWYQDHDGDGYGTSSVQQLSCSRPVGFVPVPGDCNEGSAAINPGAPEVCNGIDDNCAGGADEGLPTATWFLDEDGDRYGDPATSVEAPCPPPNHVRSAQDCDDTDRAVLPGGTETCDGKRNDCDGAGWPAVLDDDSDGIENACETCTDGDGDGWGDPGAPGNLCAPDNCPSTPNPGQANADFDGGGDACDPCPSDPLDDEDGDGLCGDQDNCPVDPNAGQENADGDPYGDACDPCPQVAGSDGGSCDPDTDGDGIPNGDDPDDDNDGVADEDGDGLPDPCTGGNRLNCDDNCPFDFNVSQRDRDGDGIGDTCDPSDDLVQGGTASSSGGGGGGELALLTGMVTYTFAWEPESGALGYNVYRGLLSELPGGSYGSCYRNRIVTRYTTLPENPQSGSGFFYLVTAVYLEREGSLGDRSNGTERPLVAACP